MPKGKPDRYKCPYSGRKILIESVSPGNQSVVYYRAVSPAGWSTRLFEDRGELEDWLQFRNGKRTAPKEEITVGPDVSTKIVDALMPGSDDPAGDYR